MKAQQQLHPPSAVRLFPVTSLRQVFIALFSLELCNENLSGILPAIPAGANPTFHWMGAFCIGGYTRTMQLSPVFSDVKLLPSS